MTQSCLPYQIMLVGRCSYHPHLVHWLGRFIYLACLLGQVGAHPQSMQNQHLNTACDSKICLAFGPSGCKHTPQAAAGQQLMGRPTKLTIQKQALSATGQFSTPFPVNYHFFRASPRWCLLIPLRRICYKDTKGACYQTPKSTKASFKLMG